jgi:DNA-binding NtrC family response regulator
MLRKENILLVDDDMDILELLQRHLQSMDYHTYKAVSVKEALHILKDTFLDLLITDIRMPEVDGMQLLKFADEHYPEMPKLVITGYPSVHGAMEVIKSGATDYLTKPFTKEELREAVQKAFEQGSKRKSVKPKPSGGKDNSYGDMIGTSEAFQRVTDIIERVKDNKATVLIKGVRARNWWHVPSTTPVNSPVLLS